MSLDSWKEENYEEKFVKERASQQALKKWRGLLPENLAKHNVTYKGRILTDDEDGFLVIDSNSCSLCQFYIVEYDGPSCSGCPLYIVNGGIRCDRQNHSLINLYVHHDPIHMIEALERAVELEKTMFQV